METLYCESQRKFSMFLETEICLWDCLFTWRTHRCLLLLSTKQCLMLHCHCFCLSYTLLVSLTVKGPRRCSTAAPMHREDSITSQRSQPVTIQKRMSWASRRWQYAAKSIYVNKLFCHKQYCMQQQSASQIQKITAKISNIAQLKNMTKTSSIWNWKTLIQNTQWCCT